MGRIVSLPELALEQIQGEPARLDTLIDCAEAMVEAITGYRFWSFDATLALDGTGTETLPVPQPIIAVTAITQDGIALDLDDDVVLYKRRNGPGQDDRYYPRILRKSTSLDAAALFASGASADFQYTPIWTKGQQNVSVTGTFGFTDLIGSREVAPVEIKRAVLRLVSCLTDHLGNDSEMAAYTAWKYGTSINIAGEISVALSDRARMEGRTGYPEVDEVLGRYRNPVATTARRTAFAFGGA